MTIDRKWLRETLIKREGIKLHVHRGPDNEWSLGIGNCVDHIPEIVAMAILAEKNGRLEDLRVELLDVYKWLDEKIDVAVNDVSSIFADLVVGFDTIRHTALVEMAYMLGHPRLRKFRLMRRAAARNDWEDAARECMDSAEGRQHDEWGSDRWRGIAWRLRMGVIK